MAKLTQKTYSGFNITAKMPNFETATFDEKTLYIQSPNEANAVAKFMKDNNIPRNAITKIERIDETWVCPTVIIDECFRKYGRIKNPNGECAEVDGLKE